MAYKEFKTLGKDILIYGVMGVVARSVGLLLLPIFTRIFSVAEYGTVDILATFSSLLAMAINLSLPSALARYYFIKEYKPAVLFSTLLSVIALLSGVFFLIVWVFADPISLFISGEEDVSLYLLLAALAACFQGLNRFSDVMLRMQKRIVAFNSLKIGITLFTAALSLIAVLVLNLGVLGVFLAGAIGAFADLVIGIWMNRNYLTTKLSLTVLKLSYRFSIPMFPAVFVTWANAQTSRVLLLTTLGLGGVGVFGAGAKVASIVLLFITVFQQAWTPFAMEMLEKANRNLVYEKSMKYYSGVFAWMGLVLTCFAPEIIRVVAPSEYFEAYTVIPWLVGATFIHGTAQLTNLGSIVSEKTGINSIAAWLGFLVNLSLSWLLISRYGIMGAAVGSFIAEIIFSGLLWRNTIKQSDIKFESGSILKMLFLYIVISCVTLFIVHQFLSAPLISITARIFIAIISTFFFYNLTIDPMAKAGMTKAIVSFKGKLNRRKH